MAIVDKLRDFENWLAVPELTYSIEDNSFVEKALLPLTSRTDVKWIPMDSRYWLVSPMDFQKIIVKDWTDHRSYIEDKYDCDKFARHFWAMSATRFGLNSVGVIIDWSSLHAYNVVVFSEGGYSLYEPQNDTYPVVGSSIYQCNSAIIML